MSTVTTTPKPLSWAEVKGQKPFDWFAALRDVSSCDESTLNSLRVMSRSWTTCACGNACAVIPRYKDDGDGGKQGEPIDTKLSGLGVSFHLAVVAMASLRDWVSRSPNDLTSLPRIKDAIEAEFEARRAKAIDTLIEVEERSAILIRAELKRATPPKRR